MGPTEPAPAPAPGPPVTVAAHAPRVLYCGALGLLLVVAFAEAGRSLVEKWFNHEGYYSHGPLVLPLCAWLLWRERHDLRALPRTSSAWGLLLIAAALLPLWLGLIERVAVLQHWALWTTALGAALVLQGAPRVRATWFVWLYTLVFLIPLPGVVLNRLTLRLKLLAAELAHAVIDAVGVPVLLEAGVLHFEAGRSVLVDDVCSGLKSLVALLALAVVFAYLQSSRWKAGLMLAVAVPVAVVANAARVLLLSWLAVLGSPAAEEGPLHAATGVAVYAVALGLWWGIALLPEGAAPPAAPARGRAPEGGPAPGRPAVPLALLLALALGAAGTAVASGRLPWQRQAAAPVAAEAPPPAPVPLEVGAWRGEELPSPERPLSYASVHRVYRRPGLAAPVEVALLHGAGRRGIHTIDACYTIQGFQERRADAVEVVTSTRRFRAQRVVVFHPDGSEALIYFWYLFDGQPSAWSQDEARVGRILRRLRDLGDPGTSATIRISTPLVGGEAAAEARLRAFAAEALDPLTASLP